MQIIHSPLWGVATPGKLGSNSNQAFMSFIFGLLKSIFICKLNVITLFLCLIKYYHIMFINIVSPRGQCMDYRYRLVRKFILRFGAQRPRGNIGLRYSLGLLGLHFSCPLYFFPCSRISYLLFLCIISLLLFPCASV